MITLGLIYNDIEQRAELWYYHNGAPTVFYIRDGRVMQVECTDAGELAEVVKVTHGVDLERVLLELVEPRRHDE